MKITRIAIDIEAIEECKKSIKNKELLPLLENFLKGFDSILSIYAFPLVLVSHGFDSIYELEYRLKSAKDLNKSINDKSPEMLAQVNQYRNIDIKKSRSIEQASKELKKITNKYPFLEESINDISLNSIVNSWTLFESIMKDLWIQTLNSKPNLLVNNVLESNSNNDIDGIEGKNISINLLFKYNLNITNHLGDLLCKKYDFTGVSGIEKSFNDLFKKQKNDLSFLKNNYLLQLEISRHLIVHKGGIIDDDYLKRTIFDREKKGKKLNHSAKRTEEIVNSSIYAGIQLFKFIDSKL